ncbi:ser/Thr protein phosphatase-like protein superfamily [Leptodontidium sp. MPI-SDFR-AT-0119]|nr:ser/Thr protein phosphatase-like protein superfamily [Leptodontidium sp. MPI-SDFR-AT-0119]
MNKIRAFFSKSSILAIQILSDLHLEVSQQYSSFMIPASALYLVLASDVGRLIDYESYLAFLAKQTAQFEQVFLVLGNHEFYGLSFLSGLDRARKLENEAGLNGKLVLLHQRRFNIPNFDIIILGCTLWSAVPEDAREVAQTKVKDFKKIEGWTVDNHNASHEADLTWLRHPDEPLRRNVLVVTHHAPSMQETSSLMDVGNPWSSAFATDLLGDASWGEVKAWVFGHTHFTTNFERNGIKVVNNQRGYVLPGTRKGKSEERDRKKVFGVRRLAHIS